MGGQAKDSNTYNSRINTLNRLQRHYAYAIIQLMKMMTYWQNKKAVELNVIDGLEGG